MQTTLHTDAPRSPDQIEITPAMFAAGVAALCDYDSEFQTREEGAARIFRAMCAASKEFRRGEFFLLGKK